MCGLGSVGHNLAMWRDNLDIESEGLDSHFVVILGSPEIISSSSLDYCYPSGLPPVSQDFLLTYSPFSHCP